jgi:hypothetical protein
MVLLQYFLCMCSLYAWFRVYLQSQLISLMTSFKASTKHHIENMYFHKYFCQLDLEWKLSKWGKECKALLARRLSFYMELPQVEAPSSWRWPVSQGECRLTPWVCFPVSVEYVLTWWHCRSCTWQLNAVLGSCVHDWFLWGCTVHDCRSRTRSRLSRGSPRSWHPSKMKSMTVRAWRAGLACTFKRTV